MYNLHVCTVHQQYQSTFLLFQTEAHNYKIIGMLKTIKIPTIAPTCFGSRRNHHQGAISCLAKTIKINVMAAYQPVVQVCCTRWRKELAQQAGKPP
jgi:hypothetical protein